MHHKLACFIVSGDAAPVKLTSAACASQYLPMGSGLAQYVFRPIAIWDQKSKKLIFMPIALWACEENRAKGMDALRVKPSCDMGVDNPYKEVAAM